MRRRSADAVAASQTSHVAGGAKRGGGSGPGRRGSSSFKGRRRASADDGFRRRRASDGGAVADVAAAKMRCAAASNDAPSRPSLAAPPWLCARFLSDRPGGCAAHRTRTPPMRMRHEWPPSGHACSRVQAGARGAASRRRGGGRGRGARDMCTTWYSPRA
jgi:hypothetical protein